MGIIYPADLYYSEGNLFTLEEVKNTFATNFNFIDYYRIRLGIENNISINGVGIHPRLIEKPIWPAMLSLINKSKVLKASIIYTSNLF